MEESEDELNVNLKKYKGHFRKFPWALIIRVMVAGVSIAIIFVMIKTVGEVKLKEQQKNQQEGIEIEVEYE